MSVIKKKFSKINIFRRVVQTAAFILFPGLFVSIFYAIRDVYLALIGGSFSLSALSSQIWILLAVIPLTVLMGRFFCGFLCAFGSMGDFFWYLSGKFRLPHFKVGEKTESVLKIIKYLILLFILIFIWSLGVVEISDSASPWTVFGVYASLSGWPSAVYLLSAGGLLLLLIIIASLLVERFFCRYLCPLGAIFALISRIRLFRFRKPRQVCNSCKLCSSRCPMGIPLYSSDTVKSGECIDCFACLAGCPRGNVTANPTPPIAAVMTVAAITGLYYAGNLVTEDAYAVPDTVEAIAAENALGQYTDGIYSGSASGFRGITEVEVTVENGNIASIEIISTGDDQEFFNKAENIVVSSIISAQSTEVDTVSGATYSSRAIIDAVADALTLAGAGGGNLEITIPEGSQETEIIGESGDINAEEDTVSENTESSFSDGVYSGTGNGYCGDISVGVTVEEGKIADITVLSSQDDEPYFSRAESGVIDNILTQQKIAVDTVSGATFSSNGIIEAVADALGLEYENVNEPQEGKGFHGGHNDRK